MPGFVINPHAASVMGPRPKMRQIRKAEVLHTTVMFDNTDSFAAAKLHKNLTLLHIAPDTER